MAERPAPASLTRTPPEGERARLAAQLERARIRLTDDLDGIGAAVRLGDRFRDTVRRHPGLSIGAGIGAGILIALLSRSSRGNALKTRRRSKSLFLGLLGLAGREILRQSGPAIARFARKSADHRLHRAPPTSP